MTTEPETTGLVLVKAVIRSWSGVLPNHDLIIPVRGVGLRCARVIMSHNVDVGLLSLNV